MKGEIKPILANYFSLGMEGYRVSEYIYPLENKNKEKIKMNELGKKIFFSFEEISLIESIITMAIEDESDNDDVDEERIDELNKILEALK